MNVNDVYEGSMDGFHLVQELQNEIKKWSDETFGEYRTGKPIAYHLKKEIDELINSLDEYHERTYNGDLDAGSYISYQKRKNKFNNNLTKTFLYFKIFIYICIN
jgi:hypothetical protein